MDDMSRTTRQKTWRGQPRRVSVLAEMAIKKEKVAERLLELRESHGLSQEDAARKVGITHRQWQRWEQGESMPYPRNLEMVASRFGISITDFFDDEPLVVRGDGDQIDRLEAKLDAVLERLDLIAEHVGVSLPELDWLADLVAEAEAPADVPAAGTSRARRAAG